MQTLLATYRGLPDGTWGAIVHGAPNLQPGARIVVARKDGTSSERTVRAILMRQDDGSCIVSLEDAARIRHKRGGFARKRETGTGGNGSAKPAARTTCPHCGGAL